VPVAVFLGDMRGKKMERYFGAEVELVLEVRGGGEKGEGL